MNTRNTPTPANYGPSIPDEEYAERVDDAVSRLDELSIETLENVAGVNAITAELDPALTAYAVKGYWLTPAATNTGPVTVDFGPGAVDFNDQFGNPLAPGAIGPSATELIYFNGVEFRQAFSVPASVVTGLGFRYFEGFEIRNNAIDANNDIDIEEGNARDSSDEVDLAGGAKTKKLDEVFAEGTGAGAILQSGNLTGTITITTNTAVAGTGTTFLTDFVVGDVLTSAGGQARRITVVASDLSMTVESAWGAGETGVSYKRGGKAKNTNLRIFAIYRDSDGAVDYAASARDVPVDLPAGYANRRVLIGYMPTDSSANNRRYRQDGNRVVLKDPFTDFSGSANGTVTSTITSSAPPSVLADLLMSISVNKDLGDVATGTAKLAATHQTIASVPGAIATHYNTVPEVKINVDNVLRQVQLDASGQYVFSKTMTGSGTPTSTYSVTLAGWEYVR